MVLGRRAQVTILEAGAVERDHGSDRGAKAEEQRHSGEPLDIEVSR